jgi:hypothetical protein
MAKIYFQDYPDKNQATVMIGYVDSETGMGEANLYSIANTYHIDINENGIVKQTGTYKQDAYKFASEAIDKVNK